MNGIKKSRLHSKLLVALLTACALPALVQAHDLKVCKVSDPAHPVTGSFTFEVELSSTTTAPYQFSHFATLTALAGACSQEILGAGYGPYRITEIATANTVVTAISSTIVWNAGYWDHPLENGFIDSNLAGRWALVYAEGGGTTTVSFTNSSTPPTNKGCTPGYYKQSQHFDSWPSIYTPTTTVGSVFTGVDASLSGETLLDALQGGGGTGLVGAETVLLRAAVAALLNASVSGMNYPLTAGQIIDQVNAALATGNRDAILTLAATLDSYNNGTGGCPLS